MKKRIIFWFSTVTIYLQIDHETKEVKCQHGPHECYGNKVHACAIEKHPQKQWLDFIYCDSRRMAPYNEIVNERVGI